MSSRRRARLPPPRATTRRRRLFALTIALVAIGGAVALASRVGSNASPSRPSQSVPRLLEIVRGPRVVIRMPLQDGNPPSRETLRRLLVARLPQRTVVVNGGDTIGYRYDIDATVTRALRLRSRGGRAAVIRRPVFATIRTPVVRQFAPNTCEAAALAVLLASTGATVSQQRLQAGFARSGPLDPAGSGPQRVWGDPDRGYVGRPEGGGIAGGFGVYPGPVAATARRHDRELDDLTGSTPARIYARLLSGRAVMAWIGLSDGPYGEWRSPQGKPIKVNFGEHTIVLTGITRDGALRVVNPLMGTLERWERGRFEAAWQLLGRRALGASS